MTFPLRADADDFGDTVDQLGWELAFASLGSDEGASMTGQMSLEGLRELVMKSVESDWHMPDFMGDAAVLKSNLSVALNWEAEGTPEWRDDDAYSCYPERVPGIEVVRVLFQGQEVIHETLLTVRIEPNRRRREEVLFVPRPYRPGRKWYAEEVAFALAGLVNNLRWCYSYEGYMEEVGVHQAVR
ncbi:hypothetical protein [Leifsonia poae]|uniref:hypothetical protein n=1 Tax=Leifsonia poae TaxID=110933 RepID=UPI003D66629C